MELHWFSLIAQWSLPLFWGILSTIGISVLAYSLGIIIGFAGAIGKVFGGNYLKYVLDWYTTLVRALPELLLIIFLYYLATDLINQFLALLLLPSIHINGFLAAVLVLGIVQGAYHTEVLRGAIQSVPLGQIEAARAYGMSFSLCLRRVIIPTMLPNALSGLANLWLNVTKDSSLVFVIGYSELLSTAKQAAGSSTTKHYFLFFSLAALGYFLLSVSSLWGFHRLERKLRRGQPQLRH